MSSTTSTTQTPNQPEPSQQPQQHKPAVLEEDDEFEDFPVEDWQQEEAEQNSGNVHLWEESWDDDDTAEDFSKLLKEELKKVEGSQRD